MSEPRSPSRQQSLLGMLALVVLAFLQGSGSFRLGSARVMPDLVLCTVVAWAFLYGPGAGALWGFVGGLLLDGLSLGPIGEYCLILTLIGALVGATRLGQYSDEQIWVIVASVSGSLAFYAATIVGAHLRGASIPVLAALPHVLFPALVLNALSTIVLVSILRRGGRRRYGHFQV